MGRVSGGCTCTYVNMYPGTPSVPLGKHWLVIASAYGVVSTMVIVRVTLFGEASVAIPLQFCYRWFSWSRVIVLALPIRLRAFLGNPKQYARPEWWGFCGSQHSAAVSGRMCQRYDLRRGRCWLWTCHSLLETLWYLGLREYQVPGQCLSVWAPRPMPWRLVSKISGLSSLAPKVVRDWT